MSKDTNVDLKEFLERCAIGAPVNLKCIVQPKIKHLSPAYAQKNFKNDDFRNEWVIPSPRLRCYCETCGGTRNYNPSTNSFPLARSCIDLGQGLKTIPVRNGKSIVTGSNKDQFLEFMCADCTQTSKKFSLAVKVKSVFMEENEDKVINLELTKYGEIPKPIKPINPKIKRLIRKEWDLYRKGADDEAAGNGIGAFAYYRRVIEASKDIILDAMCDAAAKLGVSEENINLIKHSKTSNKFTDSIKKLDHLFPSELKFNEQNALIALYSPLSEGLHNRSDEECLYAATHIRTLLDALGERLEQVIDNEDRIQEALKHLKSLATDSEPA